MGQDLTLRNLLLNEFQLLDDNAPKETINTVVEQQLSVANVAIEEVRRITTNETPINRDYAQTMVFYALYETFLDALNNHQKYYTAEKTLIHNNVPAKSCYGGKLYSFIQEHQSSLFKQLSEYNTEYFRLTVSQNPYNLNIDPVVIDGHSLDRWFDLEVCYFLICKLRESSFPNIYFSRYGDEYNPNQLLHPNRNFSDLPPFWITPIEDARQSYINLKAFSESLKSHIDSIFKERIGIEKYDFKSLRLVCENNTSVGSFEYYWGQKSSVLYDEIFKNLDFFRNQILYKGDSEPPMKLKEGKSPKAIKDSFKKIARFAEIEEEYSISVLIRILFKMDEKYHARYPLDYPVFGKISPKFPGKLKALLAQLKREGIIEVIDSRKASSLVYSLFHNTEGLKPTSIRNSFKPSLWSSTLNR